jgi:ABC-type amino acid transport substrate-binding protein
VLAVSAAALLLLGACDGSGGGGEPAAPSPSRSAAATVLRMVGSPNEAFLTVVDGKPGGFSGELAAQIARRLGRPLIITLEPFDELLATVRDGRADIAMCAITISPERLQEVAFSAPYFDSGQSLLVKKGSGIHGTTDLQGKTVAAIAGTSNEEYARGIPGVGRIVTVKHLQGTFDALLAGRADAVVCDTPFALHEAKQTGTIEVAQQLTAGDHYGIALRKGDVALMKQIDDALAAIKADGTYDTLYRKYFGE